MRTKIMMSPLHKADDFLILSPVYYRELEGFCQAVPWLNFILGWLGTFEREM